jgi:hypothetical protein
VRKAILHLDDIAGSIVFSESEQSKNGAGGMVPLYAARVQDLGLDHVAEGGAIRLPKTVHNQRGRRHQSKGFFRQ